MKRHNSGFTLIELMVSLAIIGILTAIAIPQYKDYVIRTRLTDAVSALSPMQAVAENYWYRNRTFANFDDPAKPAESLLPKETKNFTFKAKTQTATTLEIEATGKNAVSGFVYSVNQNGDRATTVPTGSGYTGSTTCWIIGKGGKCAD